MAQDMAGVVVEVAVDECWSRDDVNWQWAPDHLHGGSGDMLMTYETNNVNGMCDNEY